MAVLRQCPEAGTGRDLNATKPPAKSCYTAMLPIGSECDVCKKERRSKARVADGGAEASAEFPGAKPMFATNAVKYHVDKLRAKAWAAEKGQLLHHAVAKDKISSVALQEKHLCKENLTWLQRHDQDYGSLYGVLPLCFGMPVVATDHVDRGRGVLRGCAGEIVGWVWPADAADGAKQEATRIWNELPACILVRFQAKTSWRVHGIDEDNSFPSHHRRTMVSGQGAEAASTACHAQAVSIGASVRNDCERGPRANLQKKEF